MLASANGEKGDNHACRFVCMPELTNAFLGILMVISIYWRSLDSVSLDPGPFRGSRAPVCVPVRMLMLYEVKLSWSELETFEKKRMEQQHVDKWCYYVSKSAKELNSDYSDVVFIKEILLQQ